MSVAKAQPKKTPKPLLREPSWQFRQFYDQLGGAEAIVEKITALGFDAPPIATVRGWAFRGSIPSKWLLVLLLIAAQKKPLKTVLMQLDNGKASN